MSCNSDSEDEFYFPEDYSLFMETITNFGRNYKEIYNNFYRGRELYITEEMKKHTLESIPGVSQDYLIAAYMAVEGARSHLHALISFTRTDIYRDTQSIDITNGYEFIHSITVYYMKEGVKTYVPIQVVSKRYNLLLARQRSGVCVFDPPICKCFFVVPMYVTILEELIDVEIVVETKVSTFSFPQVWLPDLIYLERDGLLTVEESGDEDVEFNPVWTSLVPETMTKGIRYPIDDT